MLNKRRLLVLSLMLIPALGLTVAFAQPGGRGQKGNRTKGGDPGQNPGGGMRMRGNFDPNMIFNMMSGGQDTLDVNTFVAQSSQRDPSAKEKIDAFLQQQGISNGRLTRDQFAAYMQQRMAGRTGGPGGAPNANGGAPQIDEQRIKDSYQRRVENLPDGLIRLANLTSDRDQALRDDFDKWDKNHNGILEYDEYRDYFLARMQARQDQFGNNQRGGPQNFEEGPVPQKEEDKQVVYRRLSDLPKDLPQFFFQVAHRNPGQIALYEWKSAGMQVTEFRKYDRNSDGFITVEEVLTVERKRQGGDRRGGQGNPDAEPVEEQMLVLAGPGAVSDEALAAMTEGNGNYQRGGAPQMGNFNRGGNNRGGAPNMGNFTRGGNGGMPNMGNFNRGGNNRGGAPNAGGDPRQGRNNGQQNGNRGNRPGRGGEEEE